MSLSGIVRLMQATSIIYISLSLGGSESSIPFNLEGQLMFSQKNLGKIYIQTLLVLDRGLVQLVITREA